MPSRFWNRSTDNRVTEPNLLPPLLNGGEGVPSGSGRWRLMPVTSQGLGNGAVSPLLSVVPQTDLADIAAVPARARSRGTFELKFLIDEDRAADIMAWARERLDADPHADPELGDGYHVNSLYLDTPHFDVYHRADSFRQRKYRLRRYGSEGLVWCELKRKRKDLVRKRRVSVDEADLALRLTSMNEADWEGGWFRSQLDRQCLRPVCQVTYQRFARMRATGEGPVRLTIDSRLTARLAHEWRVPSSPLDEVSQPTGVPLLTEQQILELKFRGAMPVLFRRLVEEQQLQVTSFSKYRTSVEECVPLDWLSGDTERGTDDA
ncbi:MAG: polyphosphate polymerase domain-containing protein [Planctomycetota bacterium]